MAGKDIGPRSSPLLAIGIATLALLLGGFIYAAWRPNSLLLFRWASSLGLEGAVLRLRLYVEPYRSTVPQWVLYSLPDGLWVFAATSWMTYLWRDHLTARGSTFWVGAGWLLGAGSEALQFFDLLPGVYSNTDLVLTVLAAPFAFVTIKTVYGDPHVYSTPSSRVASGPALLRHSGGREF